MVMRRHAGAVCLDPQEPAEYGPPDLVDSDDELEPSVEDVQRPVDTAAHNLCLAEFLASGCEILRASPISPRPSPRCLAPSVLCVAAQQPG